MKAMVPVKKQTYETVYDVRNLTAKPKFKQVGDAESVNDQVIFGVLTADNFVGQIPPVQICDQNHDAQAAWYSKTFECGPSQSAKDRKNEESLMANYQFTYSFQDVQADFKTKPIDHDKILHHLRQKTYEDGWLEEHDNHDEEAIKLDFKKLNNPNLMDQILQFNEILLQQISSKKDMTLNFAAQYSKNYLLVPLSLAKDGDKIQYKLDFDVIESTVNEKHWVSVQDFIDAHRYRQSLEKTSDDELLQYKDIQQQLKDCVFFNRFQKNKCFSLYEVIPSVIDQDSETLKVYPGNDDPSNSAQPIKHDFRDE